MMASISEPLTSRGSDESELRRQHGPSVLVVRSKPVHCQWLKASALTKLFLCPRRLTWTEHLALRRWVPSSSSTLPQPRHTDMQLLARIASPQSTTAAQTVPLSRLPHSKFYRKQSHLLRELHLQHVQHKTLRKALIRKTAQLDIRPSESDDSHTFSDKLLSRQVHCLAHQAKVAELAIAALRDQLGLNVVEAGSDVAEREDEECQSSMMSLLSVSSDTADSAIDKKWSNSAALDQELMGALEGVSLDGFGENASETEGLVRFVPVDGWESVLGTWV